MILKPDGRNQKEHRILCVNSGSTLLKPAMLNQIDRFNPTIDVVDWFLALGVSEAHVREWLENKILSSTSITFMKRV